MGSLIKELPSKSMIEVACRNNVSARPLHPRSCRSSDQTLLVPSAQNESASKTEALPNFNRSEPHAATLVGLTSSSLLELAIGIARGFMASGISRTRSTCRSPFSRLAPFTLT